MRFHSSLLAKLSITFLVLRASAKKKEEPPSFISEGRVVLGLLPSAGRCMGNGSTSVLSENKNTTQKMITSTGVETGVTSRHDTKGVTQPITLQSPWGKQAEISTNAALLCKLQQDRIDYESTMRQIETLKLQEEEVQGELNTSLEETQMSRVDLEKVSDLLTRHASKESQERTTKLATMQMELKGIMNENAEVVGEIKSSLRTIEATLQQSQKRIEELKVSIALVSRQIVYMKSASNATVMQENNVSMHQNLSVNASTSESEACTKVVHHGDVPAMCISTNILAWADSVLGNWPEEVFPETLLQNGGLIQDDSLRQR